MALKIWGQPKNVKVQESSKYEDYLKEGDSPESYGHSLFDSSYSCFYKGKFPKYVLLAGKFR